MKRLPLLVLPLLFAALVHAPAEAAVKTEPVEYRQGDTALSGWLVYDGAVKSKRAGVMLIHDWMGATAHQKAQAEKLAALGYVVLVADVYGKGVRPTDAAGASAEAGKYYKDRALLRARVNAGLDYLASRPQVDATRLAVTGYCFGGLAALELARSGAAVRGVVTFHGSLASASPDDAKNIKGKVLVLHGADDPYVKQADVTAFMDEMRAAGKDWQVVQYSGAVHSFTDDRAGSDNSKGAAYNASADRRSWEAMRDFLAETLAK
ncbi:MAG: dienelactone hydrolase family protein [Candidatus Eisenbacteria bacterium]|uniref:Dienelactone hydrolase family protein n=1 Tax=Eiseniibacteriota bacterium TaxID=2212470 RepID=A0A933W3V0_UNCEI|nr:dienelactone hydrolase family protein [Candidatus Eisenbacteria bacterium]